MSKTAEATRSSTTNAPGSTPFFDKKRSAAEAAPTFFPQRGQIQTKLAIGKADDSLEQEADQMADQVQAKLSIGAPDDPYETEADQMADKVVSQIRSAPSVQTKKLPTQRGREMEEGDHIYLKPSAIQRLGEDVDGNGSRESVVAAARSMIGKIEAKHAEGGQRVGAKYLLDIFHLAAPDVWDDSIIQTAGAKMPSWCGIFAVWAHKKAGKDIGNWQMGKGVTAFGTLTQTSSPQTGDIGYIDQPFQHHCIIAKVDGDTITSVDGNSGLFSEVKENSRPRSAYTGFFTAFGAGSSVQRKPAVQRKTNGTSFTAPSSVEHSLSSSRGKGDPLPENIQSGMGSAIGADFSGVRIHQDQRAADMSSALEAQAFTHGRDIYFNRGKYNPSNKEGQHLLAHELTHTVQQGASAQRKMIQRAPDANTNPTANTSPPPYPSFDEAGKKLYIEKINLPDFKKRNSEKFVLPLHALQPRPAVRSHNEIWKEFVQGAVNAKTASFLQDKQKTTDGIYFLIAKNSNFRIIGKLEQVQEEAIFPKWNRFGKGNLHQVDHIVELQLGGSNAETNYELTDKLANTSSGNSIKIERQRRMDEAVTALSPTNPKLPSRQTLNNNYITHYSKVENWNLPYQGNGEVYWKMSEVKEGAHFQQLRQMTANEISESQGSDKQFVLYIRETSGLPMRIKLPFKKPQPNWLPGIDLTDFNFTPGTADNQEFGEIKVTLNKQFSKRMKAGRPFRIKFNKKAFLINTGYLVFQDKDKGLEGILEFNGLSPIVINEFSLHETAGILLEGNIITNIPIIDKTPIAISMIGDDFTVSKELTLDDLKDKFPKPFVVNDLSLIIFASTKKGLGVQGLLDFEIARIGKGQLKGLASTQDGFGIDGKFQFDPELFKSEIKVSYIKNEFKFSGSATLEKEKIPGVKSLTVKVNYADNKVTGDGKATLNIPGVKEFGIHIEQLENGGLLISGDVEFGSKLKSDGKVQAAFEKGDEGWGVSIKGQLDPNINIAGLSINEVKASFVKGVFDVSAKVHFGQGKISGDFDLGVTNSNVDETGKKSEAIGKELIFYASGQVGLVITKGVEAKLKVRITKEGDILIGGEMNVTEDKNIVEGKKGDKTTNKALNIWDFSQKIPIASCGVVSLVLELDAGIGLFYDFKGLTLDKGTKVTLEETSLKNLSKAKITSDISLSTGVKAGVDAYIGAKAGLQILIAGVRGTGRVNLKLTAIDANAKAKVEAGFSADEGLKFKTAEMEFDVESKIGYDVEVGVEVYLDLLVSDITLWEHKWKPDDLKGEFAFSWFDGTLNVPLKFGDNNSLSTEDVSGGLKKEIGNHAKDQKTYMDGVDSGVNKKGPDPKEVEQQMTDKIKTEIGLAYRGAHSKEVFAFNSSINEDYFNKRIGAWNKVGRLKSLKPEVKELLKSEIRKYEREEFDAFSTYLKGETGFAAGSKFLLIDDFMRFRPSLTLEDRSSLEALVPPDQKPKKPVPAKKKPVQKKEIPGEHGYAVSDEFADRLQEAERSGFPLPPDTSQEMGRELGADFSKVRVHYDNEAIVLTSEVNAQAFTHENHIFFNAGKYEPGSPEGKKLLAHELTHVLQQGQGEPVKRVAEKDATGTRFTGNYIFNPGHDGLSSGFFNTVKKFVADGNLSDSEIRTLRKDAIDRNGSVLHAELLLMAAMRNPVNVALMQAHRGGSLILSMSNILEADKNYVINFDRATLPAELASPLLRLALAFYGLSGETVNQAVDAMDKAAEKRIRELAGKQFADQADKLLVSASISNPVVPLPDILAAMVNAAADSTPGDQIMAGMVYVVARKYNHSTAPHIYSGRIKVDALIPSVFQRLLGGGEAGYSYSTDQDIRKANMLYIPTNADILRLDTRALIIHELTHAEDDMNRPTEQSVNSLDLESRAYVAQGRYMMDEIIAQAPAPGFVTTASAYVNLGALYYWSMVLAAKGDRAKYETVFLNLCTSPPASKNRAAVSTDLSLAEVTINAKIRAALLALRSPGGSALYTSGNTRLGGASGNYFQ